MNGTFMTLLFVESVLTAAVIGMFLYRGLLGMKEEDHLILDEAERHLAREQDSIRRKVTVLSGYLKMLGAAWSVLGVVLLSLWIVQGLDLI
jgi:hypothetical protein